MSNPAFSFRIVIDDSEVKKWVSRTPDQINDALWDGAQEIGELHLKHIRPYPDEVPGQRYIRTWRLLHGWRWARRHTPKGTVTVSVTNRMPYAKWVKDERFQAEIHQGRHVTVQAVQRNLQRQSQGIWQRHLRRTVKK